MSSLCLLSLLLPLYAWLSPCACQTCSSLTRCVGKAEQKMEAGNRAFQAKNFEEAVRLYGERTDAVQAMQRPGGSMKKLRSGKQKAHRPRGSRKTSCNFSYVPLNLCKR